MTRMMYMKEGVAKIDDTIVGSGNICIILPF